MLRSATRTSSRRPRSSSTCARLITSPSAARAPGRPKPRRKSLPRTRTALANPMQPVAGDSSRASPVTPALAGRVALVTGSGRGLGRAIAQHLGQLGAALAIHDLSDTAPADYGEAATLSESMQRLLG